MKRIIEAQNVNIIGSKVLKARIAAGPSMKQLS